MAVAIGRIRGRRFVAVAFHADRRRVLFAVQFKARPMADLCASQWRAGHGWPAVVVPVPPAEALDNVRRGIAVDDTTLDDIAKRIYVSRRTVLRATYEVIAERRSAHCAPIGTPIE